MSDAPPIQECAYCNVPIVEKPLFNTPIGPNTFLLCYCCVLLLEPGEAEKLRDNGFIQINCDKHLKP